MIALASVKWRCFGAGSSLAMDSQEFFVGLFSCPPTGHAELEGKVNGLGYGLVFQLSLDCMRHARGMLP